MSVEESWVPENKFHSKNRYAMSTELLLSHLKISRMIKTLISQVLP